MDPLDKAIALAIHIRPQLYNYLNHRHSSPNLRNIAFAEIRDEVLNDFNYAHIGDIITGKKKEKIQNHRLHEKYNLSYRIKQLIFFLVKY